MAQYPIPQFIESEGKIVSFLTFRQFFILIGGGAVCFVLYYLLPFFLFVILAVLIGLLVAATAFLKVDNVSVVTILFNFLTFSTKSKSYMWQKKELTYPSKVRKEYEIKNIAASESQLNRLDSAKKMVELRKK